MRSFFLAALMTSFVAQGMEQPNESFDSTGKLSLERESYYSGALMRSTNVILGIHENLWQGVLNQSSGYFVNSSEEAIRQKILPTLYQLEANFITIFDGDETCSGALCHHFLQAQRKALIQDHEQLSRASIYFSGSLHLKIARVMQLLGE